MKPEYPTNSVDSAVSCKKSSDEGIDDPKTKIDDSKINDEEVCGCPSEFLPLINNFFEVRGSILYEDVHENTSSLEKYLSVDSTSDVKINGDCTNEDEAEDEKSCINSQKLYSSVKRYSLKHVKGTSDLPSESGDINIENSMKSLQNLHPSPFEIIKVPVIPDSFQLPISSETQNAPLDAFLSENNLIDIKFPTYSSSNLSEDLTEAQRSIRLNKKSNLKKIMKKSTNEKLLISCKTKECFSPKEVKIIKKSTNDTSPISSKTKECFSPKEVKIIKKSTIDTSPISFKTKECFSPKEVKIIKKSTNATSPISGKTKECFSPKEIKIIKKSANEKLAIPSKTIECFNRADLISGDNTKQKDELKNAVSFQCNLNVDSVMSVDYDLLNEEQIKNLFQAALDSDPRILLTDIFCPAIKKQLKNENEVLCVENAFSKFSNAQKELQVEIETSEKSFKKSGKKLKQNKSPSAKNHLHKTNDFVNTKDNSFISESIVNQSNLSKKSSNMMDQNLSKKSKLRRSNHSSEKSVNEVPLKNTKQVPQSNAKIEAKFHKKNTPKKKAAVEKDIFKENDVEEAAIPFLVNGMENDLINDKVTADKNLNTKVKAKKTAPKKKGAPDNQNISYLKNIEGAVLHFNESRSNLSKDSAAAADNTKIEVKRRTRRKKASLEENEDILNKNKIVQNTELFINEVGKDLLKNEIVAMNKNLNTKVKVNKKNTPRKKAALENKGTLNENDITVNADSPLTDLVQTSTPVSQNLSMKSKFDQLNKNSSTIACSETPLKSQSNFLQLFSKVIESSNSVTFSKSNNSFAKLYEPSSTLKSSTSCKISEKLNEKQDGQLPNSSKINSINLVNLKSSKSVQEKSVEAVTLGVKRSNEDNDTVKPLKKKKSQDSVRRNNKKNFNGEILSKEDSDGHYDGKTTKKQLVQSIVGKNKKIKKSNVAANLCNQEKSEAVKKVFEDGKSLAESHLSCNSASVIQTTSQRCPRTIKSTTVKSAGAKNPQKAKEKRASLISTKSESLMNSDESFNPCSIKVTEVKSLANLIEKKNTNLRSKKSCSLISNSFSEDSKLMKEYEKLPQPSGSGQRDKTKSKHLHLSQYEKLCAAQSEENAPLECSSHDRAKLIKRKRRSMPVDPYFSYEVKSPRFKKDNSILKKSTKSSILNKLPSKFMQCKETDFTNHMSSADDRIQQESVNEPAVQICNNERGICCLRSNEVPKSTLNSDQFRDFMSSYVPFPLNDAGAHFLYNAENHSSFLMLPVPPALFSNVLMPSMTDKSQAPLPYQSQHSHVPYFPFTTLPPPPSVISTQTVKKSTIVKKQNSYPTPQPCQAQNYIPVPPFTASTESPTFSTCVQRHDYPSLVNSHHAMAAVSNQNVSPTVASQTVLPLTGPSLIKKKKKPKVKSQSLLSAVNCKNTFATNSKEISNSFGNAACHSVKPQDISSAVNSEDALTITTPQEISPNSCSNNFRDSVCSVMISPVRAAQAVEALQTHNAIQKSEMCIKWGLLIDRTFENVDMNVIDKKVENIYGKRVNQLTVREFCSNPEIAQEILKQLQTVNVDGDDNINEYNFDDSDLDKPFVEVLSDVVEFFMMRVLKIIDKNPENELQKVFSHTIFHELSLLVACIYSNTVPLIVGDFSLERMASVFSIISILYIFYHCKKK